MGHISTYCYADIDKVYCSSQPGPQEMGWGGSDGSGPCARANTSSVGEQLFCRPKMNTERQSVPLLGARQAQPIGGTTPLATLTRLNTNDFLAALGLERLRRGRSLLELLCRAPARRFANQVVTYDTIVGRDGLQAGHAWLLRQFVPNVEVR